MDRDIYAEGKARVYRTENAFLNPEAKASRDISVGFLNAVGASGLTCLDATAATGIRGIRYSLETKLWGVSFLEINGSSYKELLRNLELNALEPKTALNTSIQEFANTTKSRFDFIDLDPFGGVTPYIYDLVKIATDGSYLMVTATDTAVLCGAEEKACLRLYGAKPMHNELCHEVGMRILISYIANVAAQFNFGIRVHLTASYLHYMRAFVELKRGNKDAMASISSMGYAGYCNKCKAGTYDFGQIPKSSTCRTCGGALQISGRMWLGSICNKSIAESVARNVRDAGAEQKTVNFIDVVANELDTPLHYSLPMLTKRMHLGSVSMKTVMDDIMEKGYGVTRTQFNKDGIKTDAGIDEVIDSIRKSIGSTAKQN